jgi:hypothetical protein
VPAEFAIRNHGKDAVLQSMEPFDFKVDDQVSDSQISKSGTNSKRGPPKYKKNETMALDCQKKLFLMGAQRTALSKYSSLKYRMNDKIQCMLCPKDDALSVLRRNWWLHCCRKHADFITYRSQMVDYMLCLILIL